MTKSANVREKGVRRNTSPTPLLLSPRDMELAILKERMRCDRHSHFFSLIVFQVHPTDGVSQRKQVRLFAKILHKRLRLTDERGVLLKGGLGVLLPMTDIAGARVVQLALEDNAELIGINLSSSIFTYAGKDDCSSKSEPDRGDSGFPQKSRTINKSENSEDEPSQLEAPTQFMRPIRADSKSQVLGAGASQLTHNSTVATTHFCPSYPTWKRITDIAGASIGLLIASPIILIAAIAIKLNSKGPVFFRQLRTGQFGNAFSMYKLRTMVVDAEELKSKLQRLNERDGPAFKIKNDPRVTQVGKFLRMTGIDELPQLWNVLIGNMAIVGPRPLPCNEDAQCKTWQRRRLDTKPGLTCIWQISKSREISFEDWMRMDLQYSSKRSFRSDISLVFKTAMAVFLGRVGH